MSRKTKVFSITAKTQITPIKVVIPKLPEKYKQYKKRHWIKKLFLQIDKAKRFLYSLNNKV
jgi:hypothetical protein